MTNHQKESTTSTWIKAIELSKTMKDIEYIESKLAVTKKINRRTKAGRELQIEIQQMINEKAQELIIKGEIPFK